MYVDYSTQNISFKTVDVEMVGGTVGVSWGDRTRFYIEGNIQSDNTKNINYYDVVIGINGDIVKNESFRLGWDIGIGAGQLDVPWYSNKNAMLSLPIGLDMVYRLTDKVMLNAGVGYKYFLDLTDNQQYTICNDGSISESSGSGTCSWHGGIAGYSTNDLIGNGGGVSAQVGLTYKF
jgi:hypothetical protein